MNWLKEENCFHRWLAVNPLPADVQALWNKLMYFNNISVVRVDGKWLWTRDFRVSNDVLAASLQVSRTQIDRLRNRLIQSGRILYKKGTGSKGGIYSFIPFDDSVKAVRIPESDVVVWFVSQYVTQSDTQPVTQTEHNLLHKSDSYNPIINNKYKYKYKECEDAPAREEIQKNSVGEKKKRYGKHVLLTDSEYTALCRDYPNAGEAIAYLDEHIALKGYKAESHYLALRKWVFDALREQAVRRAETDRREARLKSYETLWGAGASRHSAPGEVGRLPFDLDAICVTPKEVLTDEAENEGDSENAGRPI